MPYYMSMETKSVANWRLKCSAVQATYVMHYNRKLLSHVLTGMHHYRSQLSHKKRKFIEQEKVLCTIIYCVRDYYNVVFASSLITYSAWYRENRNFASYSIYSTHNARGMQVNREKTSGIRNLNIDLYSESALHIMDVTGPCLWKIKIVRIFWFCYAILLMSNTWLLCTVIYEVLSDPVVKTFPAPYAVTATNPQSLSKQISLNK